MVLSFNPLVIGSIFQTIDQEGNATREILPMFQSPSNRVNIPNYDVEAFDEAISDRMVSIP